MKRLVYVMCAAKCPAPGSKRAGGFFGGPGGDTAGEARNCKDCETTNRPVEQV
jgi:hypothetical protein